MSIQQQTLRLKPKPQGFHLITEEILAQLPPLPKVGLLQLFIQHTSAGLSINENADPDVQTDLKRIFDQLVKEKESYYTQHGGSRSLVATVLG